MRCHERCNVLSSKAPKVAEGPRWRRRAGARPEEILDAALAEFTARGFEAARMEDIAKAAGHLEGRDLPLLSRRRCRCSEALIEAKVAPLARPGADVGGTAGAADPLMALRMLALAAAEFRMSDAEGDRGAAPDHRHLGTVSRRSPNTTAVNVVEKAQARRWKRLIDAGKAKGAIRDVDTKAVDARVSSAPSSSKPCGRTSWAENPRSAEPQKLIESTIRHPAERAWSNAHEAHPHPFAGALRRRLR